ncbi:MAG: sigma-54 dependent transcriptional regulator [Candidatus Stygibacter frigidus]|nr:sigma-54 dependent transcriptional regulator [Candidatus Stygibacter frigidus]
MNLHVLIMDDDKRITIELQEYLQRQDFEVDIANDAETGLAKIIKHKPDILFLDIMLGEANGLEVLERLKKQYPKLEVIMITGHGDMDTVIEAMRLGAFDFLKKPFKQIEAKIAIGRTSKFILMQQELQKYQEQNSLISLELENKLEREFIGESRHIKNVLDNAVNVAGYEVNVLITGESGTGKEIISRIIHYSSNRKRKSFFPINCSAIPETLMESIFFGHKKGSFTGADEDRKGIFELADGGTLFLDEIADMPVELQSKLLRVIEEKKFRRIGMEKDIASDVRIVAATNHDLDEAIKRGSFRLDLYHRLNTMVINIPPLRQRREDIKPLVNHFLHQFCHKNGRIVPQISDEAMQLLNSYDFPGNVRELKNLIERALILAKGSVLTAENFPVCGQGVALQLQEPESYNLEDNETRLIKAALVKTAGNQTQAAELLGISRHTLIRRLERWRVSES